MRILHRKDPGIGLQVLQSFKRGGTNLFLQVQMYWTEDHTDKFSGDIVDERRSGTSQSRMCMSYVVRGSKCSFRVTEVYRGNKYHRKDLLSLTESLGSEVSDGGVKWPTTRVDSKVEERNAAGEFFFYGAVFFGPV